MAPVCDDASWISPGLKLALPLVNPAESVVAAPSVMLAEAAICQCWLVAVAGTWVQLAMAAQLVDFAPYSRRNAARGAIDTCTTLPGPVFVPKYAYPLAV